MNRYFKKVILALVNLINKPAKKKKNREVRAYV